MDYRVMHIPKNRVRPGRPLKPTTLTIHSTANLSSTAINERNWLISPANERIASWHVVVDEKMAVEAIPLTEVAFHAGTNDGNNTSIGLEICESGNRQKTIENAAEVSAKILFDHGWGIDKLRRHYDWSKKICPRIFYDNGSWKGWTEFKQLVQNKLNELDITKINVNFEGHRFVVNGYFKDGHNYVKIRDVFEKAGFKVGWNEAQKEVTIR